MSFGAGVLILLTAWALWDYTPPLSSKQRLGLRFDEMRPGAAEPLVVAGAPGVGDFLFVRYLDAGTVAFGYDKWGVGGPVSAAVVVVPGAHHVLELEYPSLQYVRGHPFPPARRLKVVFDGRLVLDAPVEPDLRRPTQLWFGRNPIGGSACGPEFRGQIFGQGGQKLTGGVRGTLSRWDRVLGWLDFGRWQALTIFVVSIAAGYGRAKLSSLRLFHGGRPARGVVALCQQHRAFALTSVACVAAFVAMVTGGSGQIIFPDNFGSFYDYQALSLLAGRLDVPADAIANEAFVFGGKSYGYFGPTPALLRLPFAIFDLWPGKLTRLMMIGSYLAVLLGAYRVALEVAQMRRGAERPASAWTVLFTLNVGLGSTLFFLGSRAYLYHEAILVGVAFAVWACWCALRHCQAPDGRWWLGSLLCGVLSVHARPPTGLYALTFLGCIAVALAWRRRRSPMSAGRHVAIGAAAVLGVLSFNGLSYLKFRTFEGAPLRLSVQYDAARLARIDDRQFHAANIPFGFHHYFAAPNLLIEPRFPFLFLNVSKPGPEFSRARIDYADRTLALPYAMTGLCLAAGMGLVFLRRAERCWKGVVTLAWLAAVPMALALLAAVAISHRYTADFCPFLILAGTCGVSAISSLGRLARVAMATVFLAATVWSIALSAAITVHYQGAVVWGMPDGTRERYEALQRRVDGWLVGARPP